MAEKKEIFKSEFLEMFGKLKDFVEKNISTLHVEEAQQTIETTEMDVDEPISKEETAEKTSEDIAEKVSEILTQVQDFTYKDKINRELHEELQTYKSGFQREILFPLLKNIIHWHGKVTDQYKFYNKKQQEENADFVALFPVLLKEYKNLANGLEDLLYDYDIELELPVVGEEFNPRTQKSSCTVEAEDETLDRKIAECINAGFRDTITGRLLKQPEVAVYQKQQQINNL
jgi:hypothetical protein